MAVSQEILINTGNISLSEVVGMMGLLMRDPGTIIVDGPYGPEEVDENGHSHGQ